MYFLALLLVCGLMWLAPLRRGLPVDVPRLWISFTARWADRGPWLVMLLVLLPLLPLAVLQWWLGSQSLGLMLLLLSALVLLACMGRRDPLEGMTARFEAALARGDQQAASQLVEHELGAPVPADADGALPPLVAAARRVLLREVLHGYVVTVFWFVLLGPVGALGYRLLHLLTARQAAPQTGPAPALVHALEWLPARLLAVSFALVGHFDHVRDALAGALLSWDVGADELVDRTAVAALSGGQGSLADEDDTGALADTRTLLKRALLAWAVVMALLVVLG
ncbi:regulatory signaling modulator protein AmpE [Halopseudomonas maritima]|uniref:regulatory signaling modulator protein AmpE n=1 Tax=Halopseudomonas maritima TaxID=2918528 RepID=UPI001EEADEA6|nr:regulatory signaling modulator protein AmpE [Halopseudomonas maritima]UJJ32373.1 regulatory signaling modulator protein AmpE [Halopseudomonas maritima]